MSISIGKKSIGHNEPVFIIGEIGINHNGNLGLAKKLIDEAIKAGADAIKFQKRTVPVVYSAEELSKPREVPADIIAGAIKRNILPKENLKRLLDSNLHETTNGDLKWTLEFTPDEYKEIDNYCKEKDIIWFASPWDEESVDVLDKLDVACYKIASAGLTDNNLLKYIKKKGKPMILSVGMSTMEEVENAVEVLGKDNLILLHTLSTYPSENEELNLSVINTLRKKFPEIPIGYSGHERGTAPSLAATALGACVIERHITLDRTMWGSDQAASLEPKGFELLIRDIRVFEKARGDGKKRLVESEIPVKEKLRRK